MLECVVTKKNLIEDPLKSYSKWTISLYFFLCKRLILALK